MEELLKEIDERFKYAGDAWKKTDDDVEYGKISAYAYCGGEIREYLSKQKENENISGN